MDKKRYIEVETAYSIAKKVVDAIANGEYHAGVFAYDIMDWIDELPAADVREVVRGKWVMTTERFVPERICSSCKCRFPVLAGEGITEVLNYCPNCGARMEKADGT